MLQASQVFLFSNVAFENDAVKSLISQKLRWIGSYVSIFSQISQETQYQALMPTNSPT